MRKFSLNRSHLTLGLNNRVIEERLTKSLVDAVWRALIISPIIVVQKRLALTETLARTMLREREGEKEREGDREKEREGGREREEKERERREREREVKNANGSSQGWQDFRTN
jgi:hypothetical protein